MFSSNPALRQDAFTSDLPAYAYPTGNLMTVQGTAIKSLVLLGIVVAFASVTWQMVIAGSANVMLWVWGGATAGLILALVTMFKPTWSAVTSPLYAIAEGLFLGGISALYEQRFGAGTTNGFALTGIVAQAVGLTLAVAGAMFLLFAFRIITVTAKFRAGVTMAVGAVMLYYVAVIVLRLFGVSFPMLHDSGPLSLGISAVIIVIAAVSLLLDFDMIEKGAEHGAPKHMEWYGAFALMVTLIWLYLAILRLLAKLKDR
jgi:uncharacterized YccA/Bax inhibitor family protein